MRGLLTILSGPSGVGKDTVLNAWMERDARVRRVVACTTRRPRPGEIDGVDYHFTDHDTFLQMASQGKFLEYKQVHENWYATPIEGMEALLSAGCVAVLKIDVQGALDAMALRPDALTIFLMPPSIEVLDARIRGRGTDSTPEIERRLKNAHDELAQAPQYQHRVVNDQVERTVDELELIVESALASGCGS